MKRNKYINTFDTTAEYENYIESAAAEFPNVALTKDNDKVNYMSVSPNNHVFYGELVDASQDIPEIILTNNYSIAKRYTPTVDTINNTFYIDDWEPVPTFNILQSNFLTNKANIKSIKKFKNLDTSSVTDMNEMFNGCSSLTSVDLSSLDTSNVTHMKSIFSGCSSLTSLDLSNCNTSNVVNTNSMFNWCSSLVLLDLSNCDFSNVTNIGSMFYYCESLTDVYITVEATLNKLTNNLSSQSINYIPSNNGKCTIHYTNNGVTIDYKWQNNAWTSQS